MNKATNLTGYKLKGAWLMSRISSDGRNSTVIFIAATYPKSTLLQASRPSWRGKRSGRSVVSNWLPIPIRHLFFLWPYSKASLSAPEHSNKTGVKISWLRTLFLMESWWINHWHINKRRGSRHLPWPGVFSLFDRGGTGNMLKRVSALYRSASYKQHIISHNLTLFGFCLNTAPG